MLTAPDPAIRHQVRAIIGDDLPGDLADIDTWPASYRFNWSPAERAVLRRRRYQPPSTWAPRHFVVPTGPFEGARMSLDVTPHLAGIMDAAVKPYVREISFCAAPQTGKTTIGLAVPGWLSVYSPGPTLLVYPTEATGVENMQERIQPAYRLSPQLASLRTGRREDEGRRLLRLKTMYYRLAWSGSVTALANRSIKILILDEVDKYADRPSEDEAGTIDLARIRCRTFRDHKIFMLSSPSVESGHIWTAIRQADAVFVYWVTCPSCATHQIMDFTRDRFYWPHGDDGHSVDRRKILSRRLARYVCHHCGSLWDDDQRNQAARMGSWRLLTSDFDSPYDPDQDEGESLNRHLESARPRTIGFLTPSWISSFVSLSEVAHDFLKGQDKTLPPEERFMAYQNFQNKQRAMPWRPDIHARPAAAVLKLREDRQSGMVPGNQQAACLVAGVDTQDNGFYYVILAAGYGLAGDRWVVRYGFVATFAALEQVLWQDQYKDASGVQYPVQYALQDSLGHRTAEVYDFCRRNPGRIHPTAGKQELAKPYNYSQVEFWPGTKKPFPGGLQRIVVNTTYYKNLLAARLETTPGDPGALHLPADVDEDFAAQCCAEVRDQRGHWQQIGSRANHYWDCLALAFCAADVRGVQYWPTPDQQPVKKHTTGKKEKNRRW